MAIMIPDAIPRHPIAIQMTKNTSAPTAQPPATATTMLSMRPTVVSVKANTIARSPQIARTTNPTVKAATH